MIAGYGYATWRYHPKASCPYEQLLQLTVSNDELAEASGREHCRWCARHPDAPSIADLAPAPA